MADDIIPAIQGGGQQGAQRGNAGGVDYRQLQNPEQVRTDLPDSGAAARAAALAGAFHQFEEVTHDISDTLGTKAGALAGAASGNTGHPQYRQGLLQLTAYGRAFNNAATGAYAVQAEAQADSLAARLRVEANKDPNTFNATYSAARDAVLKNAPAQAVPMLTDLYNKRLAAGLAAITGDQLEEDRQHQRQAYDEGISRDTSQVAYLQGLGTPQGDAEAADQLVKLTAKIEGGVTAGLFSASDAQARTIIAHRQITEQVFTTQFDNELAKPDGNPGAMLENFRLLHNANLNNPNEPTVLSEAEFNQLMTTAKSKLQQQRLIESYERSNGRSADQLKYQEGDRQATSLMFRGGLTTSVLDTMVRNQDLTPERATALQNMLATNAANGKGNTEMYFKLHNDPQFLDMKPADIARYVGPGGLNGKQADELAQDAEKRRNSWEGTQQSKQAVDAISVALKIPPGTEQAAMTDDQRKAFGEARQEYIQLMNNIDPSKRAGATMDTARTVIAHANQRAAAAEVTQLETAKTSQLAAHGANGYDPWSAEKIKAYTDRQDAAIAAAQARAKGQ